MKTQLKLQDSLHSDSSILYDRIVHACKDSMIGGGAFAFVSRAGIELLLCTPEFVQLLSQGEFTLVIGMDAITNTKSIEILKEIEEEYSSLHVFAFIHDRNSIIFHPKMIWFSGSEKSSLILGSGNLTLAGLRFNYEAFTETILCATEFTEVKSIWETWLSQNTEHLYKLDDEIVKEKAAENEKTQHLIQKIKRQNKKERRKEDPEQQNQEEEFSSTSTNEDNFIEIDEEWVFDESASILIAEVPRSGDRWRQINFNKETFEGFFGANARTSSRYIFLRSYFENSGLGEIERRPNVSVISHNYRFEFGAATGAYPKTGRPILTVVKIGSATFLYTLFLPEQQYYTMIHDYIDSVRVEQRPNVLVRKISSAKVIKSKIPSLPIFKRMITEPTIAY